MNRKSLKVIFYPSSPNGEILFVPAEEIVKKIGASTRTHKKEFAIINAEETDKKTIPVIDVEIRNPKGVHVVLWNPMPEEEIKKLLNYDPAVFSQFCLTSVNHNFIEKEDKVEKLPQEKKWEELLQKKKVLL